MSERNEDRGLRFKRPGGGVVTLSSAALRAIEPFRQRDPRATEAGGVLLGRILLTSPNIVVDAVTTPSSADRRSRFTFRRSRRPAQAAVERAWKDSGGTSNYLGEWHTHPEDVPHPSGVDLRDWVRIAREATFEQDAVFFIIAGRCATRVWEVSRGSATVTMLSPLHSAPNGLD